MCLILASPCQQVSLPSFELAAPAYYILALSEASSNLARYDGIRYGLSCQVSTCVGCGRGLTHLQVVMAAARGRGIGQDAVRLVHTAEARGLLRAIKTVFAP